MGIGVFPALAHRAATAVRAIALRSSGVTSRVQLTSDGLSSYLIAVPHAFGTDVDFGQLIKLFSTPKGQGPDTRYSPGECVGCRKEPVIGAPDLQHVSTSFVERQNLTMRMGMRRFTRLTNAFSKRWENHEHAIALHYFHYNFVRVHSTIKTTPAVRAGLASRPSTMFDFVKLLEREEERLGGRVTDYKPAASNRVAG